MLEKLEGSIRKKILVRFDTQTVAFLEKAILFAKQKHHGQARLSGEEYIIHPMRVCDTLLDLKIKPEALAAALLHDVLEDTSTTEAELKSEFGKETLELVRGVTKLKRLKFRSEREELAENFRKMLVSVNKDKTALIIKLADRLHNMQTIQYLEKERAIAFALETSMIYAPLASRLGLSYIKCELEDLCFSVLKPKEFAGLVKEVEEKRKKFKSVLTQIQKKLKEILAKSNIKGEVSGRPKHYYSIYKKMNKKGNRKTLEQIFDLTAVRVLVETVSECYDVMGSIHAHWTPIQGRIKDYITVPKANNYQSLHTTVLTEFSVPCEIQIRTFEMHKVAEFGIAAHWKYKQQERGKSLEWLKGVPDVVAAKTLEGEELLTSLEQEFSKKEVFIFSPAGDCFSLPEGATPIDFAYRVHSQVGDRFAGCKINGKIAKLNTPLKNQDFVEIITAKNSKGPSRDWLKIVKTTNALGKIKAFFKKQFKKENIVRGKEMLEQEAKKRGFVLGNLLEAEWLDPLIKRYALSSLDDLFASIGHGNLGLNQILPRLIEKYEKREKISSPHISHSKKQSSSASSIIISGFSDLMVRFAHCCSPVPGDEIVGYVSKGRGVTIHRAECVNIKYAEKERLIQAFWKEKATDDPFIIMLCVEATNSKGVLAELSTVISTSFSLSFNSISANAKQNSDKVIFDMGIEVKCLSQASQIISALKKIPNVEKVYRKV